MPNPRVRHAVVLAAAAACALSGSGCDAGPGDPASAPPSAETTDYFGDPSFIGRTVTVTGIVTRVITESSFVLDTRDFGDESLLVLCAPSREVAVGYRVNLSGNVQTFDYRLYAEEYTLAPDAATYAPFSGERILVTAEAMNGTRAADASSAG